MAELPSKICKSCGERFEMRPSEYPSTFKIRVFCSKDCSTQAFSKRMQKFKFKKGDEPWNKNKTGLQKHSLSTRLKMSRASKGRKKSETHRKNIALAKMGEKNPRFGKPSTTRGKHHSESTKEILREYRLWQEIKHDTDIEVLLHEELKRRGIEFQKNIPIFGRPDIFVAPNICIMPGNEYHHAHPSRYKPDDIVIGDKTAQQIWDDDREVDEILTEMGFQVFRFWSEEVQNNPAACIDKALGLL